MNTQRALLVSFLLAGCSSSSNPAEAPDSGTRGDTGSATDSSKPFDGPGEPLDAGRRDAADSAPPKDASPPLHYGDWSDPTAWESFSWAQAMDFDSTVFDGRYVYFGQYGDGYGGEKILQYDTHAPFATKSSWSFVEVMAGYISTVGPAAFASGTVYFAGDYAFGEEPVQDQSLVLSFAPGSPFLTKSWVPLLTDTCSVCEYGNPTGVSDGVHAYFAIGGDFSASLLRLGGGSKPATIDLMPEGGAPIPQPNASAFSGTHLYFSAGRTGYRIETSAPFELSSIETFDPASILGLDATSVDFARVAFDGRYVYLVPTDASSPEMFRYDTTQPLRASGSWSDLDLTTVLSASWSLNAVAFDGRYLYLIGQAPSSGMLTLSIWRFDTTAPWQDASSWTQAPMAAINTPAISAASFDGQYVYFVNAVGVWRLSARAPAPLPAFMPGGTLN